MAKVDGRRLRKDIKEYLSENHHGADPFFNIRTVVRKNHSRKYAVLDVRFDELDPHLSLWSEVADWVEKVWWPKNRGEAKAKIREWEGGYCGKMVKRTVDITAVEVGYGFTH